MIWTVLLTKDVTVDSINRGTFPQGVPVSFFIGGNGSRGFLQARRKAAVHVGQKTDVQVRGGRRRPVAHRTGGFL